MATRRKSSPRRHGSSPFGYIIFGIVAGLGIAAAAAYYLRANSPKAVPSTPVITQQQKPTPLPTTTAPTTSVVEPIHPSVVPQVEQVAQSPVEPVTSTAPTTVAQHPSKQQPSQSPESDQKPDTKDSKKEVPKQVASKPSTKSDDQIGNLINTMNNPKKEEPEAQPQIIAKATATAEKAASNTSGGPQYLQVGSFKSSSEAEAKRAQLLMQGFSNITITKAKVNDTEFNRVHIGPFSSDASLKEAQERLKSQNINATVIR